MRLYDFLMESDWDHEQARRETSFWGRRACGALFIALDTGRIGLDHRSRAVEQPGTWGVPGGAIDPNEKIQTALAREVMEELGVNISNVPLEQLDVFEAKGFSYTTFLAPVPHEFKVTHTSWESDGFEWFAFDELPDNLHFGVRATLSKPQVQEKIRSLIKLAFNQKTNESQIDPLLQSPKFRKWFKGSKVADATGIPLLCYHGTRHDSITAFNPFSHFGTLGAANSRVKDIKLDTPNIIQVYLSIKQPLRIKDSKRGSNFTIEDTVNSLPESFWEDMTEDEFDDMLYDDTPEAQQRFIDYLSDFGYDGLVYENAVESIGSLSWVIFDSKQVWQASKPITQGLPALPKGPQKR